MFSKLFSPRAARALAAVALCLASSAPALAQKVKLATTMGDIVIELDAAKAPKTVDNFLQYVKSGHYDGTIFHRVIGNFMIQGGGFDASYIQKKTRDTIQHEGRESLAKGLKNTVGMVAMARTNEPHSASSQFFINVVDNAFLDHTSPSPQGWGYAVFGKVVSGTDVVDKIKAVPTGRKGFHYDVPKEDVVIEKAVAL